MRLSEFILPSSKNGTQIKRFYSHKIQTKPFKGSLLIKKSTTYLCHLMLTSVGLATASQVNFTLSFSIILSELTLSVISGGSAKDTIHLHYPAVKRLMARQQTTKAHPFATLYTKRHLISTLYI